MPAISQNPGKEEIISVDKWQLPESCAKKESGVNSKCRESSSVLQINSEQCRARDDD